MTSRRREDDPREGYQTVASRRASAPSAAPTSRAEGIVRALTSRWRLLTESSNVLDQRGEFLRSVQYLLTLDHPDAVELVCLRLLERDRSQFSPRALYASRYDSARREIVHELPEDEEDAWGYALWKEHLYLAGKLDEYNRVDQVLDHWKSCLDEGDADGVDDALRWIAQLRMRIG